MKPVPMSRYGHNNGDCLTACVASLLECGIADLPNFSDMDTKWLKGTADWLKDNGFGCLWVAEEHLDKVIVSDSLCVAVFKTSTEDHACVARWKTDVGSDEWSYRLEEEFDPNERKNADKIALRGVLLIFPSPNSMRFEVSDCSHKSA